MWNMNVEYSSSNASYGLTQIFNMPVEVIQIENLNVEFKTWMLNLKLEC